MNTSDCWFQRLALAPERRFDSLNVWIHTCLDYFVQSDIALLICQQEQGVWLHLQRNSGCISKGILQSYFDRRNYFRCLFTLEEGSINGFFFLGCSCNKFIGKLVCVAGLWTMDSAFAFISVHIILSNPVMFHHTATLFPYAVVNKSVCLIWSFQPLPLIYSFNFFVNGYHTP